MSAEDVLEFLVAECGGVTADGLKQMGIGKFGTRKSMLHNLLEKTKADKAQPQAEQQAHAQAAALVAPGEWVIMLRPACAATPSAVMFLCAWQQLHSHGPVCFAVPSISAHTHTRTPQTTGARSTPSSTPWTARTGRTRPAGRRTRRSVRVVH